MPTNPSWYGLAEALSNALTAIGILVGGIWALYVFANERPAERRLRADELKWRRARQAKEVNDEMLVDIDAMAAMDLVDDDFDVLRVRKKTYKMGVAAVLRALEFDPVEDTEPARALRQCFDAWFYYLALIEHYIERGLISPADLEYPSRYYIGLLHGSPEVWTACERYLRDYDIGGKALKYMRQFPATPRRKRVVKHG
jgi:hypothetical protein